MRLWLHEGCVYLETILLLVAFAFALTWRRRRGKVLLWAFILLAAISRLVWRIVYLFLSQGWVEWDSVVVTVTRSMGLLAGLASAAVLLAFVIRTRKGRLDGDEEAPAGGEDTEQSTPGGGTSMKPDPDAQIYYTEGGEQRGPVSLQVLRERCEAGQSDRFSDMVWWDGLADWVPAGEVEGLFPTPPASGYPPPGGCAERRGRHGPGRAEDQGGQLRLVAGPFYRLCRARHHRYDPRTWRQCRARRRTDSCWISVLYPGGDRSDCIHDSPFHLCLSHVAGGGG